MDETKDTQLILAATPAFESTCSENTISHPPLCAHASEGSLSMVQELLDRPSVDIDATDSHGMTALHCSAMNGHKIVAEGLYLRGADTTLEDSQQWTPLVWACAFGHREVVELLLRDMPPVVDDPEGPHTFDTDTASLKDNDRVRAELNTALAQAAESGNEDVVALLLGRGADVDFRDAAGSTALTWALPVGHEDVARLLLDRGADPNRRDGQGNPPLHWAIGSERLTLLLLGRGADADAANDEGQTALLWAVLGGHLVVVRLLVAKGADVNRADRQLVTPLHAAAMRGDLMTASFLLAAGADPDTLDRDGLTPLLAARVQASDKPENVVIEDLIAHLKKACTHPGALPGDKHELDRLRKLAREKSWGSTVVTGLRCAVNYGQRAKALRIIESFARPREIDEQDAGGCTALTLAVWRRQPAFVSLLLDKGADPNAPQRDGKTPLLLACEYGYDDVAETVVRLLLDGGADVNAGKHSCTPLLVAAAVAGRDDLVRMLVEGGADVNAEDCWGKRPLHYAAREGRPETLELLLERGVDIGARDLEGRSALSWAEATSQPNMDDEADHKACMDILIERGNGSDQDEVTEELHAGSGPDDVEPTMASRPADIISKPHDSADTSAASETQATGSTYMASETQSNESRQSKELEDRCMCEGKRTILDLILDGFGRFGL